MGLYLSLAWRNIWRNKKRSLIAVSSVVFAVVIALMTRSMQIGFYRHSINNVVSFFTGYLQIHAPGYFDEQSLDRSFAVSDSLRNRILKTRFVSMAAPRLESFVLASGGEITDGVMVIGIDPSLENELTGLKKRITNGRYLEAQDEGVLLGEGLASHLGLGVGDTVILLGQGYHAVTAAGKYGIIGTVRFPTPDLNSGMVYMTLAQARDLLAAPGRLTTLAVMLDRQSHLPTVMQSLKEQLGGNYEVISWEEMMPELVQYIQTDNASGIIMLVIVYMVIGFGILGTILMMTMERTREFGMLLAVGTRTGLLRNMVITESTCLSVVGVVVGTILGAPLVWYYHVHPIRLGGVNGQMMMQWGFEPVMPFATDLSIFLWQALSVLIIALLASLYPVYRVSRLEAAQALRRG
jgi:putative ABC transport system permease protein